MDSDLMQDGGTMGETPAAPKPRKRRKSTRKAGGRKKAARKGGRKKAARKGGRKKGARKARKGGRKKGDERNQPLQDLHRGRRALAERRLAADRTGDRCGGDDEASRRRAALVEAHRRQDEQREDRVRVAPVAGQENQGPGPAQHGAEGEALEQSFASRHARPLSDCVVPLGCPPHVLPPSVDLSSVPAAPAAKQTADGHATAFSARWASA